MFGYIYLTTNLTNGKKYIGKHEATEFDPTYKGSGKALIRAIKKYGWNNFSCEILLPEKVSTICESANELNKAEKYYIKLYNAVESDEYYNQLYGGEGLSSEDATGSKNHMFGVHRCGTAAPAYGKQWYNNGKVQTMIDEKDVARYSSLGYTKGQLPRKYSKKRADVRKDIMLGRIGYTNGIKNVLIFPDEVEEYAKLGFYKGRTSKHQTT